MTARVFLGNLAFTTTEDDIRAKLATIVRPTDILSVNIISRGNRSLGYGFVELSSMQPALQVVTALHQASVGNRVLNVEIARSEPKAPANPTPSPNPTSKSKKKPARGRRNKKEKKSAKPTVPPSTPKPDPTTAPPTTKPTKARMASNTVLFVTNLPFSYDDTAVAGLFSTHCEVKSAKVVRKPNGRSKGFGFVEFYWGEDALQTMDRVNNLIIEGRALTVKFAFVPNVAPTESATVTVKATNLPPTMDESHLIQLFQELSISSCTVQSDSTSPLQVGFMEFASGEEAQRALLLLGKASLKGEIVSAPVVRVRTKRERRRHRTWRGGVLSGMPPQCDRKFFENPVPQFYLPAEYEDILRSKDEIADVEVESQLKSLFIRKQLEDPKIMNGPLPKQKYTAVFHNVVYAEETRMRVDIRRYDMHGVTFGWKDGFYVIQVPGLAEKRPSVLRGDVVLARLHDSDQDTIYRGFAYYINLEDVRVSFHGRIHDLVESGLKFDVQFTFNRTPLRLFHRAIEMPVELWQKLWCAPGIKQPRLPIQKLFGPVPLNQEQKSALLTLLHSNLSIMVLHGPPGTGKTATLVEGILQIVNRSPNSRILICAPSNNAVDLVGSLLVGKIPHNVSMFRLNGFMRDPKRVEPTLLPFCFRNKGAYDIYERDRLQEFNIILSTCVSAGYLTSMGVPNNHFTHIFVDEAGEALEPETLIPLNLASKDTSIVLAGDHKQLGPIVRSSTVLEWKYDRSLMEHLLDQNSDRLVCKLVRSYRAHPALMELYSKMFYNGQLINCADKIEVESLLKWKELPNPKIPLMFIHSEGLEAREPDSPSWFNDAEKFIVVDLVQQLVNNATLGLKVEDIGIITPYRKQVMKIIQCAHGKSPLGTVGTVENFQGQERKVIILSLVRSSSEFLAYDAKFKLGFCDNPKRLNVAISRAKALLIIVGNGSLFGSHDPHWNYLLSHFKENNLFKNKVPKWKYQLNPNLAKEMEASKENTNEDLGWDDDYK